MVLPKTNALVKDNDGRILGNGIAHNLVPVNPHNNPNALVNGHDARRHGSHAWCSPRDGLCVPYFLHTELMGRGAKSEAQMKAWYLETVGRFAGKAIGDRDVEFWRNEFASWVGTVTTRPTTFKTKGNQNMDAAMKAIQIRASRGK